MARTTSVRQRRPRAPRAAEGSGGGAAGGGDRRCSEARCTALRLGHLVASVQAGVLEEDEERRIVLVNDAFCRLFGLREAPADLVGRGAREALGWTRELFVDAEAFAPRIDALLRERRPVLSEELTLRDGRTFERDYLPADPDGEYGGHFWIFRDISAHKETLSELQVTAERYRDFVENGVASAWSHDLDGVLRSGNRALARLLGAASPEELVGRKVQEAIDPRYREGWDAYVRELVETGESRGIGTFRGVDGRRLVLAFSNVLRQDHQGRPLVRGFGEDVTERVRAEQALRRRSELENHLVAISTRLINLSTSSIDEAIEQALGDLARNLRVDLGLVYLLSADRGDLDLAHVWSGPEVPPSSVPPRRIRTRDLPALMKTLHRLVPYRVDRLAELPPSSLLERSTLESFGVRSFLVVPISTRGELMGYVGLAMLREERAWPDEVVSVVRVIGDILGGALDRKHAEEALAAANHALGAANRVLEESQRKLSLLNEMGDLLLTARDTAEAREVIAAFLPKVFAGYSGGAYLQADRPGLDPVVLWGAQAPAPDPVSAEDCWALRRSRPHQVDRETAGPTCPHAADARGHHCLCIPLLANGQLLGLLHLRHPQLRTAGAPADLGDVGQVAHSTAEQLALGLANLQLRESLRSQALHDPLTGVHNRRYLEERLARELSRSGRTATPLAVLMVDLDHFKRINDVYGHSAGDRVLAQVARFLEDGVRAEDVVARYGGEEFTVVLTGTSEEDARWVAEKLRKGVRRLPMGLGGDGAESLSLSIGVAVSPACGESVAELLEAADGALYEAKRSGRDRVVVAAPPPAARAEAGG